MMNKPKNSSNNYHFRWIAVYLLMGFIFFNTSLSVLLAVPKPNSHSRGNKHGNINPHSHNFPGGINPAGIIPGTGGTGINGATKGTGPISSQTPQGGGTGVNNCGSSTMDVHIVGKNIMGTATETSNGCLLMTAGNNIFLSQPGSDIVVKLHFKHHNEADNNAAGQIVLAAGDAFTNAIEDLDSLTVPDPIGAKGPNPVHGGSHPKKGDGNPGGGNNDNGHWGEGNRGNGKGNIWTGNQGHGVGEGMAGGRDGNGNGGNGGNGGGGNGGGGNGGNGGVNGVYAPAAPLPGTIIPKLEENEFGKAGCPVLMKWLAGELGIDEEVLQVYIENAFIYSTNIQPCEACARLKSAAKILEDAEGTRIAALIQVINELAPADAPFSPEMAASIGQAFVDHAGDDTYYDEAGRWMDALVQYVSILTDEIGFSAADAVALFTDKYGAPVTESGSAGLIAYVQMQLAALGG